VFNHLQFPINIICNDHKQGAELSVWVSNINLQTLILPNNNNYIKVATFFWPFWGMGQQ
jgi:hypothetical protein